MDWQKPNCYFWCFQVNKPLKQSLVSTHTPEEVEITLESVIKELYEEEYEHLEVISHGVTLPKQTPLIWLAKNLVYPDNFVHLVVKSIWTYLIIIYEY